MKKRLFSIILLTVLLLTSCNQPDPAPLGLSRHEVQRPFADSSVLIPSTPANPYLSPDWLENPLLAGSQNTGSAKVLLGDVLVVNVFISDAQTQWDSQSRNDVLLLMQESFDFLLEQADEYGQTLSLTQTDALRSYYLTIDEVVYDYEFKGIWSDELEEQTDFESLEGILADAVGQYGRSFDNKAVVFHFNKAGRSYACPFQSEAGNSAEEMIVFYDLADENPYSISSSTYAHELLHLFGASDLYAENAGDSVYEYSANSREYELLSAENCPDDIMLKTYFNINNNNIGEFTAFRIGWVAKPPAWSIPMQEYFCARAKEPAASD